MTTIGKQLGQARPANTTAVSIYSPTDGTRSEILQILVCNTSGSAATFRIFHDDNGTTYDQTTALYYDKSVNADDTLRIWPNKPPGFAMYNTDGNLAVRTSSGNALTFTVYGNEIT
jgi:hypothetical protein|tara:strand:+ start:272 stop:619 length:348 start_codon:yes stop_codon:yes gene_type:complete